ncbi:MAG: hypothetical protein KC583_08670 [Myxococcales bacterium]|nr:hypothetical protein [Myxococcales bacterium]
MPKTLEPALLLDTCIVSDVLRERAPGMALARLAWAGDEHEGQRAARSMAP